MREMVAYVEMVESFCRGTTAKADMNAFTHYRNQAHHQLLSLASAKELGDRFAQLHPVYEPCRLAARIFGISVVFPVPVWAAPYPQLVLELQQALIDLDIGNVSWIASDLLLWVVVLGGIAATDTPAREWYVSTLRRFSIHRGLRDWEDAKAVLMEVLWLATACDVPGRVLWDEVTHLRSMPLL